VNKHVDVEHASLLIAYLIEIARGEGITIVHQWGGHGATP